MFDDLTDLYQEIILDHGKNPRNQHVVEGARPIRPMATTLCAGTSWRCSYASMGKKWWRMWVLRGKVVQFQRPLPLS